MAKIKMTNEIKTGALVILCIAILLFLVYKTGALTLSKAGYRIKAVFCETQGVEKNAPVRLAGVEAGEVEDIQLDYANGTKVVLTLWLDETAKIRKDSRAYIATLGLMGEKYIEISPGSGDSPFLKDGGTIEGEDPFQFEALAKKGEIIAEELKQTLKDARNLTNNLNDVVTYNRSKIDTMLADLQVTAENFKIFSEDIKQHPWKLLIKGKEKRKR